MNSNTLRKQGNWNCHCRICNPALNYTKGGLSEVKLICIIIYLGSIPLSPFAGGLVEGFWIGLKLSGNIWNKWIFWIGIVQKGADGKKDLADCKSWGPLILEDIQADSTSWADVRVIHTGLENDVWWLEWIIWWESDVDEEDTGLIWRIWWSKNGTSPMEQILSFWSSRAVAWWISWNLEQFLLDTAESHW